MDTLADQLEPSVLRSLLSSFNSLQSRQNEDGETEKQRLANFFGKYANLCQELHESGSDFNIWRIAGLTDNEAPATNILAWFLDGKEAHAMGDAFMKSLLGLVPHKYWSGGKRPESLEAGYTVRVEHPFRDSDFMPIEEIPETGGPMDTVAASPEAGAEAEGIESSPPGGARKPGGSRPDVIVTGRDFLLIIEAKTKTNEHDFQLSRYARIAGSLARNRPWALVYLTPHGGPSKECEKACPVAWHGVARAFRSVLKKNKGQKFTPAAIVCEHFCEYIENF